jgi:hypothetical protein
VVWRKKGGELPKAWEEKLQSLQSSFSGGRSEGKLHEGDLRCFVRVVMGSKLC